MGYTLNAVIFICSANSIPNVVMLNFSPAFAFYVIFHSLSLLINRQADQSYLVAPGFRFFNKHRLIVLHRRLARRAPCSPEVVKNYLTLLMLNCSSSLLHDKICIYHLRHLTANAKATIYFDLSILNRSQNLLDFFRDFLC